MTTGCHSELDGKLHTSSAIRLLCPLPLWCYLVQGEDICPAQGPNFGKRIPCLASTEGLGIFNTSHSSINKDAAVNTFSVI